ncbi:MAG: hypothetical protein JRH07_06705, partial [Deltaproteobacteria bacterium]|nr:hypothetical protein [Deltaproteobacteria bacterium]
QERAGVTGNPAEAARKFIDGVRAILWFSRLDGSQEARRFEELGDVLSDVKVRIRAEMDLKSPFWRVSLAWLVLRHAGGMMCGYGGAWQNASWIDEWILGKIIGQTFQSLGCDETRAWQETDLVRILVFHCDWFARRREETRSRLKGLFYESEVQLFLQFNWYDNVLWFHKERFAELTDWLFLVSVIELVAGKTRMDRKTAEGLMERHRIMEELRREAASSGYRVEGMLDRLNRF